MYARPLAHTLRWLLQPRARRFEAALDARGVGEVARDKFYSENFAALYGE